MNVAVVTGAARGLGRRISERLADMGYRVLMTDIDADEVNLAATANGRAAWSMAADVRDPDSHRKVALHASERGPLKVWINNAGILQTGSAWTLEDESVKRHVEVNLLGVIWGARAAVEAMREGGGHIINIASMSSHVPAPGLAIYSATKHAVLGFSLALEGDLRQASIPIRVSSVCPDAIDTAMVRGVAYTEEASVLFSAGRLLSVDRIADTVARLVERPRLVTTIPAGRGALAHAVRPFPALGLRLIDVFKKIGDRRRRRAIGPP